jgi:hypothetical protein
LAASWPGVPITQDALRDVRWQRGDDQGRLSLCQSHHLFDLRL